MVLTITALHAKKIIKEKKSTKGSRVPFFGLANLILLHASLT